MGSDGVGGSVAKRTRTRRIEWNSFIIFVTEEDEGDWRSKGSETEGARACWHTASGH